MGFTREEKEKWKKEYEAKRKEKKLTRNQPIIEAYQLKKTHDWAAVLDRTSIGSGMLRATHCKKCGIDALVFKAHPVACPKKDE